MFSVSMNVEKKLYTTTPLAFQTGRWPTYFESLEEKHIPSPEHAHTYYENIVQSLAHTQSRLLPKVLDQLHNHRSAATHIDACTDVLPVYQHLRRSWKGRSWQWITTTGAIHEYLDGEQDELLFTHPCTHPVPLSPVLLFRIWQWVRCCLCLAQFR